MRGGRHKWPVMVIMNTRPPDYVLTIPDTPPSLNVYLRAHWTKRGKYLETFATLIWFAMNGKFGAECPPARGKRRIVVTLTFPTNRRRDSDNWNKCLNDAMVHAGLIKGDSPRWLDFELPTLRYERGVRETKIEVWEVEDGIGNDKR